VLHRQRIRLDDRTLGKPGDSGITSPRAGRLVMFGPLKRLDQSFPSRPTLVTAWGASPLHD
jgi:hypothetical protein